MVDVIDRDHQRVAVRQLQQHGAERVHDLRVQRGAVATVGADPLVQQVHRPLPLLDDQWRVQQQLTHHAERQIPLGVRSRRGDGQGVLVDRPLGKRGQQFGLAGGHRAGDHGDPALAGDRGGEHAVELGDHVVPFHQSHDCPSSTRWSS